MPPVNLMDPQTSPDIRSSVIRESLDEMTHDFESEEIASLIDELSLEEMFSRF
jgi:hypothetical protein